MTATAELPAGTLVGEMTPRQRRVIKTLDVVGLIVTVLTVLGAIFWAFPLYWAVVTTLKPESEVIQPGIQFWPEHFTLDAYVHALFGTNMGYWYLNSLFTSAVITLVVVMMSALAGYAISQLKFPGRRLLWWMILASFMIPVPALIINHFVLMSQFKLINTYLGVILPQLVYGPVTVIIYKQFFDSVPKEFREAAKIDGANEFQLFFRLYLPMNWGITTALAIITFIGAWNNFWWPFLIVTSEEKMTIPVGITQVNDVFGVAYARIMAAALLAAMPVVVAYLVFQRRVTEAVMISSGVKG